MRTSFVLYIAQHKHFLEEILVVFNSWIYRSTLLCDLPTLIYFFAYVLTLFSDGTIFSMLFKVLTSIVHAMT